MLESLYPLQFVEKRHVYAAILGVCYSVIALGISVIVFPKDPSLISVALVVFLLYPTIQKLLLEHEKIESERTHKGIFSFFREHKNAYLFYLIICIAVFAVYFTFSYTNPQTTSVLFEEQANVLGLGAATLQETMLFYIQHNSGVLILMLVAAFILGEGGLLLLLWNASSWGVFYGATLATSTLPTLQVMAIVTPHILIEISAYIIGAITISILTKALFSVHIRPTQRSRVINDTAKGILLAFGTIVIGAIVESFAFQLIANL